LVPDEEIVLRRVPPSAYDSGAQPDQRLLPAVFSTEDFKPSSDSYGASCYVESKLLPGGIKALVDADPKWAICGLIRVTVGALKAFHVSVYYTPMDCDHDDPTLKHAHGSFVGIGDRSNRNRLVQFLQDYVTPPPNTGV
jgi:hypothetical protein